MGEFMPLCLYPLPGISIIYQGDDLASIILASLAKISLCLEEGDILVLAQKIVSKSEGRIRNLSKVVPSKKAIELAEYTKKKPRLVELILSESRSIIRVRPGTIIVEHRLGFICANAGIDHSNVLGSWGNKEDWVLLLPEHPDKSAKLIRKRLENASGVNLGVLIIDSHGRAWRTGAVGMTIGLSGLPGLIDLRGQSDLFGYQLRTTQVAAADELAAAASLVMGQAAEGSPVVHVRGFPYPLSESNLKELIRPIEKDLFR